MNTLHVANRKEWRDWLKKHHDREMEVWLVFYKKHLDRPGVTYKESLEEALCFGWIDGLKKGIDSDTYVFRYSPRRVRSRWSPSNIRLAEQLIQGKMMTKAGLIAYEQRLFYDDRILEARSAEELSVPSVIREAFNANRVVWENFQALAPSFKKQYVMWISSAKKKETRERRLKEATDLLMKNQKLGMK